jgi:hypothetical protein
VIFENGGTITIPSGTATHATGLTIETPTFVATGTITNASSLRISGAPTEGTNNYALLVDGGASRFDGDVGIGTGTTAPDGPLHVMSASAGSVTAGAEADELIIEGSGSMGISLLTAAGQQQAIFFGDADDNDQAAIRYQHGTDRFEIYANKPDGEKVLYYSSAAMLSLHDGANTDMTSGFMVNQASADDSVLTFKSSDIAHGKTSTTETDSWLHLQKSSGSTGGAQWRTMAETGHIARACSTLAYGSGASLNADKASNTLQGGIDWQYYGHDGADALENVAANSVAFGWRCANVGGANRALMGLDEDGDIYVDGSSTISTFDHYDDIAMMAQLDLTRATEFQPHLAKMMSASRFDGNAYTLEHYEGTKLIGVMEDTLARDESHNPIPEFGPKTGERNEGYRTVSVAEQKAAGHTPLLNITAVERLNAGAWRQAHQLFDCIIQCMEDRDPGYKAALREHLVHCDLPTQIVDWEGTREDSPLHEIVDPGPIPEDRGIAPPPPAFNA